MKTQSILLRSILTAVLLTLAAPLAAAELVLESGIDVWTTRGDGSTFFSFGQDPLPADFFCAGSEPFGGDIAFKGVPVATAPKDALGESDTIVQRLDDAAFNEKGVAITRLQVRALQLEGVAMFRNWCGDYRVQVLLDGDQPVTEMRIFRESPHGGRFAAEVAINARVIFTPVGHEGVTVEVARSVVFPARRNFSWSERPGKGSIRHEGFVAVDTDANGRPDISIPGTSRNFFAGTSKANRNRDLETKVIQQEVCPGSCHCDTSCTHCL